VAVLEVTPQTPYDHLPEFLSVEEFQIRARVSRATAYDLARRCSLRQASRIRSRTTLLAMGGPRGSYQTACGRGPTEGSHCRAAWVWGYVPESGSSMILAPPIATRRRMCRGFLRSGIDQTSKQTEQRR